MSQKRWVKSSNLTHSPSAISHFKVRFGSVLPSSSDKSDLFYFKVDIELDLPEVENIPTLESILNEVCKLNIP